MTFRTTLAAALSCALILPAMHSPAQAGFEWTPPPRALPKAPAAEEAAEELPPVSAAPAVPVESAPLPTAPAANNDDAVAAARAEAAAQAAMNEGVPPSDPWAEQVGAEETMPVLNEDPMGRIAAPGTPVPRGPSDEPVIMPRHNTMQVAAPVPPPTVPVDPATVPPAPFMKSAVPVAMMAAAPGFTDAVGFGRDIPLALALQQIVPAGYSFAFTGGADAGKRVSWEGGRPWNIVLAETLAPHGMVLAIAGRTVWIGTGVPVAPYYAAPVPVTAMPMPVAPVGAPVVAGGRAVEDWQDEAHYAPSYPRRDPVAARDRMMQDAAGIVHQQEPSGNDPDIITQPASTGDETAAMNGPAGAPMPLLAAEAPVAEEQQPQGKTYTQLTGLDDAMMTRLDAHEIRYWQAQPGESLRTVLTNWSEQAGVQLFWAEGQDYQMAAPVQMHGTFQNAITKVLESFAATQPQPQGQLHPNYPNGPAVLIIDHRA